MTQGDDVSVVDGADNLRELPLWTRRYAQHRTLPFIFTMLIIMAGSVAFAGLGWLIALAYRSGSTPGVVAAVTVTVAFSVFWVWLSLAGLRRVAAVMQARLYAREGEVLASAGDTTPLPTLHKVLVATPLLLLAVAFVLVADRLPPIYMQPLTALWVVPFLVAIWIRSRANMGPLALLWPTLYALHAVLILAGAPIVFTGPLQGLNVFVPIGGYGLLTGLLAHLYSRYALARVRRLARDGKGEA